MNHMYGRRDIDVGLINAKCFSFVWLIFRFSVNGVVCQKRSKICYAWITLESGSRMDWCYLEIVKHKSRKWEVPKCWGKKKQASHYCRHEWERNRMKGKTWKLQALYTYFSDGTVKSVEVCAWHRLLSVDTFDSLSLLIQYNFFFVVHENWWVRVIRVFLCSVAVQRQRQRKNNENKITTYGCEYSWNPPSSG